MCINTVAFLHTISQHVKLRTSEYVEKREKRNLTQGINNVAHAHRSNGFSIKHAVADLEFKCVKEDLSPIAVNIVDANDHVHPIERSIRTVKERM